RLVHNAQGQVEARFDYELEDTLNAVEAQVELLGPDFGSITSAALDPTVGVPHENELLYTFAADEWWPGATYYAVLTGVDQHGVDDPPIAPNTRWYRIRDVNKRMLAVTAEACAPVLPDVEIVQVGEGDPIGGTVPVVVKVTVGGECPLTGFTVKVVAECPVNEPDPEAELTGAWYSDEACTQASGAPGQGETRWWKGEWNTCTVPLGHNETHRVEAELRYSQTWDQQAGSVSDAATRGVANLVIHDLTATPGTADYFCFDPAADEQSATRHPRVSFTIVDEGAPSNDYRWIVFIRDTRSTNWEANYAVVSGTSDGPGEVTAVVNDPSAPGQTQDVQLSEWGTYTFDVYVWKWPYRLKVPATVPGTARKGDELWFSIDDSGNWCAMFDYYLLDELGEEPSEVWWTWLVPTCSRWRT
ncbi:MAG: hypothetical protein HYU66_02765, partial [Armatimonadetes bacterium]|nr:hypothetical protein [Armatimonadota bacterium]